MSDILLNDEIIQLIVRDIAIGSPDLHQKGGRLIVQESADATAMSIDWQLMNEHTIFIATEAGKLSIRFAEHEGVYYLHGYGRNFRATVQNPLTQSGSAGGQGGTIAPMPGTVVTINVNEGDTISKGQLLLTIESMKMLTDITADQDGTIKEILLSEGDTFDKGAVLVTIE